VLSHSTSYKPQTDFHLGVLGKITRGWPISALSVLYSVLYDTSIIFPTGKWSTKLGVFQVPLTKKNTGFNFFEL
jgi:hypothetical protein